MERVENSIHFWTLKLPKLHCKGFLENMHWKGKSLHASEDNQNTIPEKGKSRNHGIFCSVMYCYVIRRALQKKWTSYGKGRLLVVASSLSNRLIQSFKVL